MKLNKVFLLGLLASASLFTACSDDDDDYSAGPQPGNINVTFATGENMALELTDTSFDVLLYRPDSTSAQAITVPIEVVEAAEVFTIPQSVSFAAGDSIAKLTIAVSEAAKPFVDYKLRLALPLEYSASTYLADQDYYPVLGITVHKEDYKQWGTMSYTSWLFEDTWESDVYYSEYMKLYRCDIFTEGYPFYFSIDDEGVIVIRDNTGAECVSTVTGYVDETYGMMSYYWLKSNFTGWDEDDQAYFIPVSYRVSAGQFGSDYDSFTLTKAE